jgi:Restriction Enzyme Adenine Methylase Associated
MPEALITLIRSGKLQVGTTQLHRGRSSSGKDATATVVEEGLRMRGRTFTTPSAAAKAITGKPVDGWIFWRLLDGDPLDSLRSDRRRPV